MHRFAAELSRVGRNRCVDVPASVSRALGGAARIPVRGTLQGTSFRSTLVPRGGGNHRLFVHGSVWRPLKLRERSRIQVTLEAYPIPRCSDPPDDLVLALARRPTAAKHYSILSPALKAEIIRWILAAKRPTTRERRLEEGMDRLEIAHHRRSSR